MWNDEDNNPYGTSFERSDSNLSSDPSTANPNHPTSCMSSCFTEPTQILDDGIYSTR